MSDHQPSIRWILLQEGIMQVRVQRIASTAMGRNYSMSTIRKWLQGEIKWPLPMVGAMALFLKSLNVNISRTHLDKLMTMNNEQITAEERRYAKS